VPDGESRSIAYAHFSPDGRKLVWSEGLISEDQRRTWRIALFDIEGSRWRPLIRGGAGKAFVGACWSPDGRWIASTSYVTEPGAERYRIEIVDPEGEPVRPIPLPEAGGAAMLIDWR
jgi:Tol biopolymer transport system component